MLLPSFEGGLFYGDSCTDLDNAMSQMPVQALAVSGQSAFFVGVLSPGGLVPLTLLPAQASLVVLLDTPFLIVIVRIIGAALPLHLAL
jgi:hypothetical protein